MAQRITEVSPFHVPCEPKVAGAHERGLIRSVPPQRSIRFRRVIFNFSQHATVNGGNEQMSCIIFSVERPHTATSILQGHMLSSQ